MTPELTRCSCDCPQCKAGSHCYENPCLGEDDYG